jgi:hypothetical protein
MNPSIDCSTGMAKSTYQLVKDHVICEHRGMIDVKGKGAVRMYYVVASR